jgi:hypothetical protein
MTYGSLYASADDAAVTGEATDDDAVIRRAEEIGALRVLDNNDDDDNDDRWLHRVVEICELKDSLWVLGTFDVVDVFVYENACDSVGAVIAVKATHENTTIHNGCDDDDLVTPSFILLMAFALFLWSDFDVDRLLVGRSVVVVTLIPGFVVMTLLDLQPTGPWRE